MYTDERVSTPIPFVYYFLLAKHVTSQVLQGNTNKQVQGSALTSFISVHWNECDQKKIAKCLSKVTYVFT